MEVLCSKGRQWHAIRNTFWWQVGLFKPVINLLDLRTGNSLVSFHNCVKPLSFNMLPFSVELWLDSQ